MVALRPDEWNPIWSSASRTVTLTCADKAAAADNPAMPPPITRMSLVAATGLGGGQPLVHDLAALGEANAFDDLVIVGEHGLALVLVPEGA